MGRDPHDRARRRGRHRGPCEPDRPGRHQQLPGQERERQALETVEATGGQALTEMRRLVGLLREQGATPEFAPQPSMKTLDVLVGTVREAGLPVEIHVVAGGHALLAPSITRRVIEEFVRRPPESARKPPAELEELTARELEILGSSPAASRMRRSPGRHS